MKTNSINVLVAVIFIAVILSTLMISSTIVQPYSPDTIFSKEFPYEGFSNYNYSNTNGSPNTESSINDFLINKNTARCSKVDGFNGLFCKPYVADNTIDKFSELKGNPSCFGNSSGLSNSLGSLCLDKDLSNALKTRGGNQTGADMQIG
jgi:hypothetical protein